uniref:Uncharacterized protein n=1 Tax=Cynoglossus semilaevis TaxID=244447 RepID=A0A3P8VLA6_CYNSE
VFTFRLHGNNEQEKNMAWLDGSDPGVYCLCLIYLPCCSFFSVSDHRHSYWRTVRKSYATTKNNELFYRKEPQSVNLSQPHGDVSNMKPRFHNEVCVSMQGG